MDERSVARKIVDRVRYHWREAVRRIRVASSRLRGRASPMTVHLRPPTDADLARIVEIEQLSFSSPWPRSAFETLLSRTDNWFRAAQHAHSGEVVGYLCATYLAPNAEIVSLAVAPEARGSGVGATLLERALSELKGFGVTTVFLEVRESNTAARALYGSRGFLLNRTRRNYYQWPQENGLELRRDLA